MKCAIDRFLSNIVLKCVSKTKRDKLELIGKEKLKKEKTAQITEVLGGKDEQVAVFIY